MLRSLSIPLFILATGERKSLEFRYTPLCDKDFEELMRAQSLVGEERRAGLFRWLSGLLADVKIAEGARIELSLERVIEMGDAWAYRLMRLLVARTWPDRKRVTVLTLRYSDVDEWRQYFPHNQLPEEVLSPFDLTIYEMAWELKKSPDEIRAWSPEDRNWMLTIASAQSGAAKIRQAKTSRAAQRK